MIYRNSGNKRGRAGMLRNFTGAILTLCLVVLPVAGQEKPGGQGNPGNVPTALSLPSPDVALALTVGGSVLSGLLVFGIRYNSILPFVGACLAPSTGFFYGGLAGRGFLMSALRFGMTWLVLSYALNHDESNLSGLGYAWVGGFVGSMILECATVKKAVRKHNEALMAKHRLSVAVAPFAMPKGGGVQVRLTF